MISWSWLFVLLMIERPHQWLALLRPEAAHETGAARAREWARLAFLVGLLEALGFYVAAAPALWAVVFWTQTLHVAWTAHVSLATRGVSRALAAAAAAGTLVVAAACVRASGPDAWSWLGAPGVFTGGEIGDARGLQALVVFWIVVHAIPCAVARLKGLGAARGTAMLLGALALAYVEWRLVAGAMGFPGTLVFPDLADTWDLGREEGLWVAPVWCAFYFAHVAVDFRRGLRSLRPATSGAILAAP